MSNIAWFIIMWLMAVALLAVAIADVRLIHARLRGYLNEEVNAAVAVSVEYIQQVYVDKAKANQSFACNGKNQKEALNLAVECARRQLSPAANRYLHHGRTDDEINDYLISLIEATIKRRKLVESRKQ